MSYTRKEYAEMAARANKEGKLLKIVDGKPVLVDPPAPTFEESKADKFTQIAKAAGQAYISGFVSTATGDSITFDSTEDDQRTLDIMYAASKSPDFEAHPVYQGKIPLRGKPEGSEEKQVYYLDAFQMQKIMDDLALHIGTVKTKHWQLQAQINAATAQEQLDAIEWEFDEGINYT